MPAKTARRMFLFRYSGYIYVCSSMVSVRVWGSEVYRAERGVSAVTVVELKNFGQRAFWLIFLRRISKRFSSFILFLLLILSKFCTLCNNATRY